MGSTRQSSGTRRVVVLALAALVVIALSQRADPSEDSGALVSPPLRGTSQSASVMPDPVVTGSEAPTVHAAPTTAVRPPTEVTSTSTSKAPAKAPHAPPPAKAPALWEVTWVVDGDTIHVSRGGVVEKVRLIGIDTPERDDCGYSAALDSMKRIIGGRAVTLVKGARTDRDQYGRLLRYVSAGGTDVGLALIKSGYAVARFDSRDGYGSHAREDAYIAADRASADKGWACATPVPVKPQTDWPLPGDEHPCPQARPVKGNESSMIAHSPGQQSYLVTNPEQCFATLSDAVAAGFRPAKR